MQYFDSHAHYEDTKFDEDREEILKKIYEFGVTRYVNIGCDINTSQKSIDLAQKHDFIYASVGIHPEQIDQQNYKQDIKKIEQLATSYKVVAIGEIGLDYYWNNNKSIQKQVFLEQIDLANRLKLPVIIHTRDAICDTIDIIRNDVFKTKAVLHCCPFNIELVKAGLEKGFYIAFGGTCTFKNSKNANEIIKKVPIQRILIETDSPYLSPEPKRGMRNDSRNLQYIVRKISQVKNVTQQDITQNTYENAMKFFNIK